MAIKWKSSYSIFIAAGLLTIGGLLMLKYKAIEERPIGSLADDYRLQTELGEKFVLNYIEKFDDKTLSAESVPMYLVDDYRDQHGDFESQVREVKRQYTDLIESAKDQKLVDSLTKERDDKLLAIVTNSTSNAAIKKEIVKRESDRLLKMKPKLVKKLKKSQSDYTDDNFFYYFEDEAGVVVTNLKTKPTSHKGKAIRAAIASEKVLNVSKVSLWPSLPEELREIALFREVTFPNDDAITGYMAIKEGSKVDLANQKMIEEVKKNRVLFMFGLVVFAVGVMVAIRFIWEPIYYHEQAASVRQLPVDLRLVLLVGIAFVFFFTWQVSPGLRFMSVRMVLFFIFGYLGMFIELCLLKNGWLTLKKAEGYQGYPAQVKSSLICRGKEKSRRLFGKLPKAIRLIIVLGYFLVLGLLVVMASSQWASYGLFVLLLVVPIGSIPLIIREYRLEKLLKKPQEILEQNQEGAKPTLIIEDSMENLLHIEQIISVTHDNRQRSENLKTELLTNVSHDLRTPLTSIISYGDLLTKDKLTDKDRGEYVEIINRKAMRMKNLIDDLFAVTKMNNGDITLDKKVINLGQLLQQSLAEYGDELAKKELKIMYLKPEEPLMMLIDGDRMWRVFDNLIGNVVKYAMPNTRVYLKLEEIDQQIRIELKNISLHELNENASNLVERFTRGDEARNTEGAGLGLAIVNSIVNLHGGSFEIVVDGDMFKTIIYLPWEKE